MPRRGALQISTELLRTILDLPSWCEIDAVRQTPDEYERACFHVVLTGKWLPDQLEGAELPRIEAIYQSVEPAKAHLKALHGLDT